MVVNLPAAAGGLLVVAAARGDIDFAADDGFDALVAGGLVKINGAIEDAVVGDGKSGELEFVGTLHEPVEPAGAIEQGILGVQVEMDKVSVRHAAILHPGDGG